MNIVIGNRTLASYPGGGGHWTFALQHFLGLRDLGHQVTWLETMATTGNTSGEPGLAEQFFQLMSRFGAAEEAILVVHPPGDDSPIERGEVYGRSREDLKTCV